MTVLDVYVPAPDPLCHVIDRGSGIVGKPAGDLVLIYYEGNRYGAVNLRRYLDRVVHAAGRLEANYPTVAKALAKPEQLVKVGVFSSAREGELAERRIAITDSESVREWLR